MIRILCLCVSLTFCHCLSVFQCSWCCGLDPAFLQVSRRLDATPLRFIETCFKTLHILFCLITDCCVVKTQRSCAAHNCDGQLLSSQVPDWIHTPAHWNMPGVLGCLYQLNFNHLMEYASETGP